MPVDAAVLEALEHHGVTAAHFEMLLRYLSVEQNGSWRWNWSKGRVVSCDVQLSFPSRPSTLQHVSDVLLSQALHEGRQGSPAAAHCAASQA